MERLKLKLMLKTNIFLIPKRPVWNSLRNIEACQRSATGVRRLQNLQLDGSGLLMSTFGIDGMTANGTSGVYQNTDSLTRDGPGTRATGIIVVMFIDTTKVTGGDSKAEDG